MPFLLDGTPTESEISEAVNYLLANFDSSVSSDAVTGQITGPTGEVLGYLYKYMAVKYADSFDGSVNFSDSPTNRLYYGLRNNNDPVESTNPVDYIWSQVTGGFGTTKFLFYKVNGGRQIDFFVGTTSPGYAWLQAPSTSIDLDSISVVITATVAIYKWTATSTPPARPATSTTYTWATGAYTAPAGWDIEAPSNTTPGSFLWEIAITLVQTGGLDTSTLDWPNAIYAIRAVSYNGENGATGATGNSALTAYRVQDQASATPTFTTPTSGPNAPTGWTLGTPSVAVGQVLWYIQGEYNSSTTITINGVAPNTTRWTGPIAASVFQDIRSDNWNGSNPPSFSNPATWGTAGYYIARADGTAILNNLGARGTLQSGSSPAISGTTMTGSGGIINSNGTFALGNPTTNISFNGTQMTLNGSVVNTNNVVTNAITVASSSFTASDIYGSPGDTWVEAQSITITTSGDRVYVAVSAGIIIGVQEKATEPNDLPIIPEFRFRRGSTILINGGPNLSYSEIPSAGTYTYYLDVQSPILTSWSLRQPAGTNNRSMFVIETKR
jgi:hypothetical protein